MAKKKSVIPKSISVSFHIAEIPSPLLDERGREFDTRQFAAQLGRWLADPVPTAFVIGGADGLDPALKKEASLLLRVSAFTLPHALAQVVLCEQLYRAASLLEGHPYHRE